MQNAKCRSQNDKSHSPIINLNLGKRSGTTKYIVRTRTKEEALQCDTSLGCHIFKGVPPTRLDRLAFSKFPTYQTLASEKTTEVHQSPPGEKILSNMMNKMPLQVPYG